MILASHIKYVQDWINRWKISLYYPPPDAGAIKSSDEVVDKEIYIGIIAGITILFLITAGIAVWLAHVRKERYDGFDKSVKTCLMIIYTVIDLK